MIELLHNELAEFLEQRQENRLPDGSPCFAAPLLGVAAANDPLFDDYRRIIGPFHLLPEELLPGAASVVVWVLPVALAARAANRHETRWPARAWAQTRYHGERCNVALRRHLVAWLETRGAQAVAPQLSPHWQEFATTPVGIASRWSERHAAYAAGLGTFSLNDGLITVRGIAHRLGSIVTTLALAPTPRSAPHYRANCLYFHNGSCGHCVTRCPAAALSLDGHDKERCRDYVYGAVPAQVADRYGTPQTGCGLCQTAVPCEAGIPRRSVGERRHPA